MANQWLRLWHDMPNDPKWRTISRASGQRYSDVVAVYMHLLVSASQNVTRGHTNVTAEDLASAIDVTEEVVKSILDAMQGRVLDGTWMSGWDARQPKKEDSGDSETGAMSAAERKRQERERKRKAAEGAAKKECHDKSQNVTTDKEEDKDKEEKLKALSGKPDDTPPNLKPDPKPKPNADEAIALLTFLNVKARKGFKPVAANLDLLTARMAEGYTPQEIRAVIARKCRDWSSDDTMAGYLRPATLFNRLKFSQYAGECVVEAAP